MVKIRHALNDDLNELVELLGELFAIESDFSDDADKQLKGLELLLRQKQARLWVAELEETGEIVAMCSVQVLISTAEGAKVGLIEDLIVTEAYRYQGIGQLLLQQVLGWAEAQGLKRLQLLADKNNQGALDFYATQSWQTTNLVGLRRLL